MSFPRYERYKDSGVEWLGEVPEHWRIAPLYSLGKEREESNVGLISNNLLSLSYGRIIEKDIETSDGLLPESFETYQIVHPGDIIFRLTDLQNDKRSLRTAIVTQLGIITFAYAAFEPRVIMPAYLSYLLRDYDLRKIFYSMGGGVRQSMKFDDIRRLPTLVPSKNEQSTVVHFLDYETTKIDALIEEQRRLIELLKEKRQAVISHAVTRGLNPDAPVKDCGVDWIGLIPQHWEVSKLGQTANIVRGGSPRPAGDSRFFNGDFMPWITVGEVTKDDSMYLVATESMLTEVGAEQSRTIDSGTLVLTNSGATLGVPKILGITGCANDGILAFLDLKANANKKYLYFVLGSLTSELRERMKQGSGQPNLNTGIVSALQVPLLPVVEQLAIVAELERMQDEFGALMTQAETSATLLQERRSALISAAVTGKIDVRHYTPKEAS